MTNVEAGKTKTFEIYLNDLTPTVRNKFLKFIGIDNEENFKDSPIAIIEIDEGAVL